MGDYFFKRLTFFILFCVLFTNGSVIRNSTSLSNIAINNKSKSNKTLISRSKRAFDFTGGLASGFGAYDYYNYYGDLVSDYSYDYYDWICSESSCQLCDVLTSECCDPDVDVNCFLPDTCFNNPCLSGGTCITARTVDDRPDFTCVCLPGLTGKYCQLVNDYFLGAERLAIALMNAPAVLGGLGGVGLSIPTIQGAPPIPPALAVLSEIQNRLGSGALPPSSPPSSPGLAGLGPQHDGSNTGQKSVQNASPTVSSEKRSQEISNYPNQYSQSYLPQSYPQYHQESKEYLPVGESHHSRLTQSSFTDSKPINQDRLYLSQNYAATTAANKRYNNPNSGLNVLGAKRVKCPDGQIFNGEKGECAEFTLRKKKIKAEEKTEQVSE